MSLREVRARALSIPLSRVTSMSTRTVTAREYVLVSLDAGDGRPAAALHVSSHERVAAPSPRELART